MERMLTTDAEFMPVITCWGTYAHPWKFTLLKPWPMLKFFFAKRQRIDYRMLDSELPVCSGSVATVPGFMWLGHSTVLVNFVDDDNQVATVLTDPVFSSRVPAFYGPKRFRLSPIDVGQLPESLCAVVISHTHYDHLDAPTIDAINQRFGSRVFWLCGVGVSRVLRSTGCQKIVECNWFDEYLLSNGLRFVFAPAQHWSARSPVSFNRALWGSWIISDAKRKFYFAGDTGYYEPLFKHIGNRFGPFDLAAIPIGAYIPRDALSQQHVDPNEAVKIHEDIRSKKSIGIHWGTFQLGQEHWLRPKDDLKKALEFRGLPASSFVTVKHGEFHDLDIFART
ncbi:hypothetical protein ACOME3_004617 [Neoechinorhynchus agilis]